MLFNSLEFIFLFLPVTLVGWFAIGRVAGPRAAILWLIAASFVFYAWWNVRFIALLAVSIGVNFWIGSRLSADATPGPSRRMLLLLGIGFNLAILGYFKYANFFVDNIQAVTGASFAWEPVLLPIAISFFTFQKIAFLADAYWGRARAYDFAHFSLFVMFFPQLIAGPIVHHREIIPQIEAKRTIRFSLDDFAAGLTIFAIGLAKKVVVADHCGEWASRLFAAADNGLDPGFFDAWIGALSYTLQIYFDFSAYSDMAVGLARMFGFRMPINFDSPYKAASIIDFWRRWHMTLSRFLRDYLYIPLGGSRRGRARQYLNILVTMFLSGLWHGAGWTFVLWGSAHGAALVVNHLWRQARARLGWTGRPTAIGRAVAVALTFAFVTAAFVVFRAESIATAERILLGMAGVNGLDVPARYWARLGALAPLLSQLDVGMAELFLFDGPYLRFLALALLAVWFLPNTADLMARVEPVLARTEPGVAWLRWRPSAACAVAVGLLAFLALQAIVAGTPSPFLYFQF